MILPVFDSVYHAVSSGKLTLLCLFEIVFL